MQVRKTVKNLCF